PGGGSIQLVALARPAEFPFIWWRIDGSPATQDWDDYRLDFSSPAAVVLRFNNPRPPAENPGNSYGTVENGDRFLPASTADTPFPVSSLEEALDVGLATGPWIDTGTVKAGDTFTNDDLTLTITRVAPLYDGEGAMAVVKYTAPDTLQVHVLAVSK